MVTECNYQALPKMRRTRPKIGLGVASGSGRDQEAVGSATSVGEHTYVHTDEPIDLRIPQRPPTPPRDGEAQNGHTQTGRATSIKYRVEFRVEFRVEITVELGPL